MSSIYIKCECFSIHGRKSIDFIIYSRIPEHMRHFHCESFPFPHNYFISWINFQETWKKEMTMFLAASAHFPPIHSIFASSNSGTKVKSKSPKTKMLFNVFCNEFDCSNMLFCLVFCSITFESNFHFSSDSIAFYILPHAC